MVVPLLICDFWTQNPLFSQNLKYPDPERPKIESSTYNGQKSTATGLKFTHRGQIDFGQKSTATGLKFTHRGQIEFQKSIIYF